MGKMEKLNEPLSAGRFKNVTPFTITLPEGLGRRWCTVCYLIFNRRIKDLITQPIETSQQFAKFTAQYLSDYIYDNKKPPAEIAPAIMNLAEDFYAGRTIQVRAGDYIVLQGYLRKTMGK